MKPMLRLKNLYSICLGFAVLAVPLLGDGKHDLLSAPTVSSSTSFKLVRWDRTTNQPVEEGMLFVTWELLSGYQDRDASYRASIYSTIQSPLVLSLYNIGLQGRACETTIMSVTPMNGSTVKFAKDGTLVPQNAPVDQQDYDFQDLPPVGLDLEVVKGSTTNAPQKERVGFMKLTGGSCTLIVKSKRKLHGWMDKDTHETTPPPPNPGGNDGEN